MTGEFLVQFSLNPHPLFSIHALMHGIPGLQSKASNLQCRRKQTVNVYDMNVRLNRIKSRHEWLHIYNLLK